MIEQGEIFSDSENSELKVMEALPPRAKRPRAQWQETLINLVAAQQQQIALLSSQTKSVTVPSPSRRSQRPVTQEWRPPARKYILLKLRVMTLIKVLTQLMNGSKIVQSWRKNSTSAIF